MTEPDDAFERELRALLRDRAAGPVPASLRGAADDALRTAGSARWSSRRLRRPVVTLVAAAAAAVLVGASFNPVSVLFQAVTVPGAGSPSPSSGPTSGPDESPNIVDPPFDWGSLAIELTATDISLLVDGAERPVPTHLTGSGDPGDQRFRTLELAWDEEGVSRQLILTLLADDTHWWVAGIQRDDPDEPDGWTAYVGADIRTPIGQAYAGNLSFVSESAVPGLLVFSGVHLDPIGLGTGPSAFTDCGPASQEAADMVGHGANLPIAVEAVDKLGVCHVYRWTYPLENGVLFAESWCTPPPAGIVRFVILGERGELIIHVDDGTVRAVRHQPRHGWACKTDVPGTMRPPEETP